MATKDERTVSTDFDSSVYCNATDVSALGTPGKDWVLCVFDATGTNLLAVGGQQSLSITRGADSIDVSSKDTVGGWKSSIAGMKNWSVSADGVYIASDSAHTALTKAYENGDLVCLKIMQESTHKGLFGGLAAITDYSLTANYDDKVGYSMEFEGNGALTDLTTLSGDDAKKVNAIPTKWQTA